MITHVAIWRNDTIYALPKPNRHHNVFKIMPFEDRYTDGYWDIQGFLDEQGNFLDRRKALVHAAEHHQVIRPADPKFYQGNELFSEDLW